MLYGAWNGYAPHYGETFTHEYWHTIPLSTQAPPMTNIMVWHYVAKITQCFCTKIDTPKSLIFFYLSLINMFVFINDQLFLLVERLMEW